MTEQETRSKAEARRERSSDGNHLNMDTVASGMAAAGLGLALLQQDMTDAKAAESLRPHEDRIPNDAGTEQSPSHVEVSHANDVAEVSAASAQQVSASDAAEGALSRMEATPPQSATSGHSPSEATTAPSADVSSPGETVTASATTQSAPAAEPIDAGHGMSSGIQNLLSGASSTINDVSHALEQKADAIATSITDTIGSTLDSVTSGLSTLSSQIGGLFGGQTSALSDTLDQTTDAVSGIVGGALSETLSLPAAIDPAFHQAFGPASDLHSFSSGVIDTSGLASFGSLGSDTPLSFLAQSYTDVADQSVHGLQGLTHGLI